MITFKKISMQTIGTTGEIPTSPITKPYTNNKTISNSNSKTLTEQHTSIEMTGTDRPGLFSEISAALSDLHCKILEAHAWSHNRRLACVAYVSDQSTDTPIDDPHRLATIEDHLTTVLGATDDKPGPSGTHINPLEVKKCGGGTVGGTNVERRLHQLMVSVRDFDGPGCGPVNGSGCGPVDGPLDSSASSTVVWIESCEEKGYSIVSVECVDRPRLMFDTVCTLTDLQYVIFHASLSSHGGFAFQVVVVFVLICLFRKWYGS